MLVVNRQIAPHLNNVVFVEGGVRVIKRYKRLMLRRIKWQDITQDDNEDEPMQAEDDSDEEVLTESKDLKCHLVWEGLSTSPAFGKFEAIYDLKSDLDGRRIFSEKGVEHCWHAAVNFMAKRAIGLGEEDNVDALIKQSLQ